MRPQGARGHTGCRGSRRHHPCGPPEAAPLLRPESAANTSAEACCAGPLKQLLPQLVSASPCEGDCCPDPRVCGRWQAVTRTQQLPLSGRGPPRVPSSQQACGGTWRPTGLRPRPEADERYWRVVRGGRKRSAL